MRVFSLTQAVQQLIAARALPSGILVDMTVGTGGDTAFLTSTFPDRPILAIDIQEEALDRAKKRVIEDEKRIHWRLGCHSRVGEWLQALEVPFPGVALAMYNLGYLPGSDKSVITKPLTTIASLEALFPYIVVGGMISLMIYTGHAGGVEEREAIEERLASLPISSWSIWELSRKFANPHAPAPLWLMIQKIA